MLITLNKNVIQTIFSILLFRPTILLLHFVHDFYAVLRRILASAIFGFYFF